MNDHNFMQLFLLRGICDCENPNQQSKQSSPWWVCWVGLLGYGFVERMLKIELKRRIIKLLIFLDQITAEILNGITDY